MEDEATRVRNLQIGDGINKTKAAEIRMMDEAMRRKMADKLREFDATSAKIKQDGDMNREQQKPR